MCRAAEFLFLALQLLSTLVSLTIAGIQGSASARNYAIEFWGILHLQAAQSHCSLFYTSHPLWDMSSYSDISILPCFPSSSRGRSVDTQKGTMFTGREEDKIFSGLYNCTKILMDGVNSKVINGCNSLESHLGLVFVCLVIVGWFCVYVFFLFNIITFECPHCRWACSLRFTTVLTHVHLWSLSIIYIACLTPIGVNFTTTGIHCKMSLEECISKEAHHQTCSVTESGQLFEAHGQ